MFSSHHRKISPDIDRCSARVQTRTGRGRGETQTCTSVAVTLRENQQSHINGEERDRERNRSTSSLGSENTPIHSSCHFPLYSFASVIAEWSHQFIFKLRGYIHCLFFSVDEREDPIPVSALKRDAALLQCQCLRDLNSTHWPNPPLRDLRETTKIPGSYHYNKQMHKTTRFKSNVLGHMCKPSTKLSQAVLPHNTH